MPECYICAAMNELAKPIFIYSIQLNVNDTLRNKLHNVIELNGKLSKTK